MANYEEQTIDLAEHLVCTVEPSVFYFKPSFAKTTDIDSFIDGNELTVGGSRVWSVGRRKEDGKVFVALDDRFYMNPRYDCLWLR